ncbi:hypothetical protein CXK86_10395 [Paenibacillus sp. BGI2013]|nr:hypothetical protein BK136_06260 [Paenibacillus amylolyticus]PKQ91701.1 hypothetical protein CXK86_10395 [Paenibacillus sp. BGI2013]
MLITTKKMIKQLEKLVHAAKENHKHKWHVMYEKFFRGGVLYEACKRVKAYRVAEVVDTVTADRDWGTRRTELPQGLRASVERNVTTIRSLYGGTISKPADMRVRTF